MGPTLPRQHRIAPEYHFQELSLKLFLPDAPRHHDNRWRVRGLLLACLLPLLEAQAQGITPPASGAKSAAPKTRPLAIKVYDDRMTVAVAGAPQVYLSGVIDADAPRRLAELVQSWKVPAGSDVYLNATGDDLDAGMALGRLLRKGAMSTHLGQPTRGRRTKAGDKSSICTGACVYAYLGGVYRWAPAGHDRFGIVGARTTDPQHADAAPEAGRSAAYLKDMGIDPAAFAAMQTQAQQQVTWLTADQMIMAGLANNGHQPLVASYRLTAGVPKLELNRVGRRGAQRLTLQCKPGSVALTAYNEVGANRAQQIVRHAARSYLEVDQREMLSQPAGNASVERDTLVIDRAYPPDQLGGLLYAKSVGAWINQRNSTLRYGFAFNLAGIDRALDAFYHSCWKHAPWPVKPGSRPSAS